MYIVSGWVEGFLDHMGKAYEVVLLLLKEIIPQLGISITTGSDVFVAKIA